MQPTERQWLEVTYAEHHGAVCGFLRLRAGDLDWQGIAQDVFVTAVSKMHLAPAEPRAWLLGIARGLQANASRLHFHGDVELLAETPLLAIAELDPLDPAKSGRQRHAGNLPPTAVGPVLGQEPRKVLAGETLDESAGRRLRDDDPVVCSARPTRF